MKFRAFTGMVLIMLFMGMLTLAFNIQPFKTSGTLCISSDYTSTSNIHARVNNQIRRKKENE